MPIIEVQSTVEPYVAAGRYKLAEASVSPSPLFLATLAQECLRAAYLSANKGNLGLINDELANYLFTGINIFRSAPAGS